MTVEVIEVYEPQTLIEEVVETPVEFIEDIVERGPMGPPGGLVSFVHSQIDPAASWVITHDLGRRPNIILIPSDSEGQSVFTDVYYPSTNVVSVEWPTPTSGLAELT